MTNNRRIDKGQFVMMKGLTIKPNDSVSTKLLKAFIRVLVASILIVLSYLFAIMATMGPEITPAWDGKADYFIRIGWMLLGFALILVALLWLVWPLLHAVYKKLMAKR